MGDCIGGENSFDSDSTLNALQRSFMFANRNKPLPVPDQDEEPWSSNAVESKHSSAGVSSGSSMIAEMRKIEATNEQPSVVVDDDQRQDFVSSPRSSLKSMLNRSSRLFRNSTISMHDGGNHLSAYIRGSTQIRSSQCSLTSPSPRQSRDVSPANSQSQLSSSISAPNCTSAVLQTSSSSADSSLQDLQSRPKPSPASSTQTQQSNASNFGFMRRTSSRTSSSLMPPEEGERPTLSRADKSYSSSTSSRSGHRQDESAARSDKQHKDSRHPLSRHSQPTMARSGFLSTPPHQQSADDDDTMEVVAHVAESDGQAHKVQRPPLMRSRSRSVDALASGAQGKSMRIGDLMSRRLERPLSSISMSKSPSSGKVQEASNRAEDKANESTDRPHSRQMLQREGTLSRLAGSIRRTAHQTMNARSAAAGKTATTPASPSSDQKRRNSLSVRTMKWQGSLTTSAKTSLPTRADNARVNVPQAILSNTVQPPKPPPKDPIQLRGDAWWDQTSSEPSGTGKTKIEDKNSSHDSTLKKLEAAHLAAAINAGDDTVEDRMAAAVASPKNDFKPLSEQQEDGPLPTAAYSHAGLARVTKAASTEALQTNLVAAEVKEDVNKYEAFICSSFASDRASSDQAMPQSSLSSCRPVRLTSPPTAYNPLKLPLRADGDSRQSDETDGGDRRGIRSRKHSSPDSIDISTKVKALTLDVDLVRVKSKPRRSSTSLGMASTKVHGLRRASADRGPTLDIVDDMEFLRALEDVRRTNQERIRNGGGRQRTWSRKSDASSREDHELCNSSPQNRLNSLPMDSPLSDNSTCTNSSVDTPGSYCGTARPSALEMGVGKASGKLRDGAFLNDDDWKKEVKALFVIRELVLTERSYARHLEALLHAVRPTPPASVPATHQPVRRSTTPSLLMASASATLTMTRQTEQPPPPHVTFLRNLLPQLITLSRTLANQIDENPTAAGVGAAFRLISAQMESVFVAWSAAVKDIMDALRASENVKSRSRFRIGLIVVPSAIGGGLSQVPAASAPSSPVRASRLIQRDPSHSQTDFLPPVFSESPMALTFTAEPEEFVTPTMTVTQPNVAKRRSTISASSLSAAGASWQAKLDDLNAAAADEDDQQAATMPSSPSSGGGGGLLSGSLQRTLTTVKTTDVLQDRRHSTPHKKSQSGSSTPRQHSTTTTTTTTTTTSDLSTIGSSLNPRRFTAMDIAIMPTQRIPRYLLLLRDLHANTPPSSLSHARVQRSLDFVHRVATDCDRASKITFSWSKPMARMR